MHGSSGSRGLLVHLLAGAALGAVVVLMVWIFSGGRPFGEVVGTSDVSSATPAAATRTDVQTRTAEPGNAAAQLESEPPDLGAGTAATGGSDAIRFRKPKAAKAKRVAAARREARSRARARARKRQVVRVVAPPDEDASAQVPVAAVPSPEATTAPPAAAPAPQGGGGAKPAKPRTPTYVAGAGEG